MVFAEEGELVPELEPVNTIAIIKEVVSYLSHHNIASNKTIEVVTTAFSGTLKTDPMLLKRVIINMVKNALEATPKGGTIYVNCELFETTIAFTVRNSGMMPEHVQAQVFQRSFSTKGKGRGLGTYSIKLLTERYLKGLVGFTSSEEKGTEFFVRLPINSNS
jgi:signal transduction histidine kinase